jgi:hypothetical protein
MPIQIILIILFVLAIIKVVWRFHAHDISWQAMVLWILFWLAGIVIVSIPDITFQFARLIGVQRGADAVVYGALTLVFFILFRLLLSIERLKKEITILNRKIALYEVSEKRHSNPGL